MNEFPQHAGVDKRQGEVTINLNGLEESIERLQLKVNNLVMNLTPVVGPDKPRPTPTDNSQVRPMDKSPFAERLLKGRYAIEGMIDLIDYTTDRLEL